MRRLLLAAAALAAAVSQTLAAGPAASAWPQYLGNAQHTSSTTATSPSRLKLGWATNLDGVNSGHTIADVAIGVDGSIYAVTMLGPNKVSPAGTVLWSLALNTPISFNGPAVTNDGLLYVANTVAIGAPTGAIALSTNTGSVVQPIVSMCSGGAYFNQGSPLLTNGGTVYYTSADSSNQTGAGYGCLTSLNSAGTINWESQLAGSQGGPVALASDESAIYLGLATGKVDKYFPDSTVLLSSALANSYTQMVVAGNGNFITLANNIVKAFSPAFSTLWTYNPGYNFDHTLAVSGNVVYVSTATNLAGGNPDHFLIALNATTGAVIYSTGIFSAALGGAAWPGGTGLSNVGQMTVAGSDILIPSYNVNYATSPLNGYMIALDAATGARRWIEPTPGGNTLPGQLIPNNTALYGFNLTDLYSYQPSGAATLTVTASTGTLIPESATTITATVKDGSGLPVAGASVFMTVASGTAYPTGVWGRTDASGNYAVTFSSTSTNSSVTQETFTVRVVAQDFAPVDVPIFVESESLDHFDFFLPGSTATIGSLFGVNVYARNQYDQALPTFPGSGSPVTVSLAPFLANTLVAGTGNLGVTSVNINSGVGTVTSETYNKIEAIQIHATTTLGPTQYFGVSSTMTIIGPSLYIVTIPTGTVAGANFPLTITAQDAYGNTVQGYSPTLALAAVVANSTNTAATGSLSVTNVNLPPTGTLTINNETFSTGGGIAVRVTDSGQGVQNFSSSMTVTQPALTIDHYHITAPQSITVGSPFNFDVEPQDASSAPVSYSLGRTLNVQAFLAGTSIAGSGSLGVTTLPLAAGATFSFTASQTYNKIESVQLKVTDDDGRVGLSSYTVTFTGPTQFVVAVATSARAGVPFQFVVQAQDAGNSQVLGYNGTVNVSAVDATTTTLAGGGVLGVTSLNLSGGAGSSAFQSYTKAQGIRFRVADSGIGVTTISSSMTIVAGPAASLTLAANPQSTIATVPSVLTAQAADAFNNPIPGSTVTFTVASGSAVVTLGLVNGAVSGANGVVSTQAPTNVSGSASAFFGSTTTLFSQADLVVATLGGLTATTTIYNAVLITGAGGVVANQAVPQLSVTCPAATWGFNVRMSIAGKTELSAADLALTTAAFAASASTFVSTAVMKVDVVRDASPGTLAGAGGKLVGVALPFAAAGGNVTVGSYRGQSLLVPQSVLRVFKLNKQTSIFEMVLDGVNLPQGNGTVSAQVSDPNGIFALGAPPFVTLGGASSGTVTAALAGGAQATVSVPFGAFASPTTLTVSPLSGPSLPALPTGLNLTPTGIAISVNTGGIEPATSVGVSLGYTAAAIAGLNANQLRIARYDAGVGWKVLDSQVDTAAGTVVAQTDGFSIFEIVAAAPSSSVDSGFVFPNPFRPSLGHANIKFAGLPAAAHIRVLTVSGRLLKELDADSTGSVLSWNGTDKDGRPLASGVYLAVVSDTTGGSGKATIKFAVQR